MKGGGSKQRPTAGRAHTGVLRWPVAAQLHGGAWHGNSKISVGSTCRRRCFIARDHSVHARDDCVKVKQRRHRTLHTQQPTYVAELVYMCSEPTRLLRSADRLLLHQPRTNTAIASRAFSVAAPKIWNSLPPSITAVSYTHLTLPTIYSV